MEKEDKLVIREATPEDIPELLKLTYELAEYEKLSHVIKLSAEMLQTCLFGTRRYAEVLMAEYDGKVAGHALFFYNYSTFEGKPGIYLEDLFVRPDFRGLGIGKKVLLSIIARAKKEGCARVEWAVLDWNENARNFYKKIGAVPLDDWTTFRLTQDKF